MLIRILSISLLLFVFLLFVVGRFSIGSAFASNDAADCKSVKAVWTNAIKTDKEHDKVLVDHFSGERIYGWLKLKGGKSSLNFIKKYRKLPVKLAWYTYYGSHYALSKEPREFFLTDKEIKGIEDECNTPERGYWDFRIWDFRELPGYWKLVPFLEQGGQLNFENTCEPCEIEIVFD